MYLKISVFALLAAVSISSCKKKENEVTCCDPEPGPNLVFKFHFDPNQERLDGFGNPSTVPANHAAQSPDFNHMSAHYVELFSSVATQIGEGEVLYTGPETMAGGDLALDFSQAVIKGEGGVFLQVPLSSIPAGTYPYLRISLAYQNYDVQYLFAGQEYSGTLASFIGYNTYITSFNINQEVVVVNDDKLQGYWAFETMGNVSTGQAPPGATTVVNPFFATAPIPAGSCLVSGTFSEPLEITGNESENIVVNVSLSVNQSFEWEEVNADGKWEPTAGENVVDMGIRGMIPGWE
jgi:hypothetical protein